VTIRPGIKYFENGKVTKKFRAAAEQVRRRYDEAFRELAK
jgi:hypothetical protein